MKKKGFLTRLFMGPFAIISVWFSTHVGPGFAGGAQEVQYFVGNGWMGVFLGPLVLAIMAGWMSYWVSEFTRQNQAYHYRLFYDAFYGKYKIFFSNAKEIVALIGLIVVCGLMYATGGQLLANVTGISPVICGLFTLVVIGLLIMFGEGIVRKSATLITIILVVLVIYILAISLPFCLPGAMKYVGAHTMNTSPGNAWYKILLYFPLFVSYLDVGMVTSKGVIKTKKDSLILAIGGAALLGVAVMGMNILFASGMPQVKTEQLPTLWVLEKVVGSSLATQWLYTIFAWLALVSTGVGGISGWVMRMEPSLAKKWTTVSSNTRRGVICFGALIIALIMGQFGIISLVYYGYGLMSTLSLPLFTLPFFFLIPWRMKQRAKVLDASGETL